MISCGWCGKASPRGGPCPSCGHRSPETPWVQRGLDAPELAVRDAGRPHADAHATAHRLAQARESLERRGVSPTTAALAEELDVSDRTVRRWLEVSG